MHGKNEDVPLFRNPTAMHTNKRGLIQLEWLIDHLGDPLEQSPFVQILNRMQENPELFRHRIVEPSLPGTTVLAKCCSETLVTAKQFVTGPFESSQVEFPAYVPNAGDIVGRITTSQVV